MQNGRLTAWCLAAGLLLCVSSMAAEAIKIEVVDDKVIHTADETFSGTNFCALWNPTGASPGTMKAFSQMGLKLLRFPGGVVCQWWDWKDPLNTGWTEITADHAWTMAKAGGAKMMFQTNIAGHTWTNKKTNVKGTFDASGAHAAAWLKVCREKGVEVAWWEIGNEPEMDAPDSLVKNKQDQNAVMAWYNDKFKEHAEALKKVDPKARVLGPVSTNTWFWWAQHNLDKFLKVHGNKEGSGLADGVSLHWYPEGGTDVWEKRRGAAQEWTSCMKYIKETIAKLDSRPLPLYITEWSWGGGDKHQRNGEYGNALGTADIIGMFLRTGVAGHTHFTLQRLSSNWGVLAMKGDLKPENEPSPAYFALAMCSQLGQQALEVKNSADERNVFAAYATRDKQGGVQVLLINKSGEAQQVELAFTVFKPSGKDVKVYSLKPAHGKVTDRDAIYNEQAGVKPAEAELPKPGTIKPGATHSQKVEPYGLMLLNFAP